MRNKDIFELIKINERIVDYVNIVKVIVNGEKKIVALEMFSFDPDSVRKYLGVDEKKFEEIKEKALSGEHEIIV